MNFCNSEISGFFYCTGEAPQVGDYVGHGESCGVVKSVEGSRLILVIEAECDGVAAGHLEAEALASDCSLEIRSCW